jgi:hypothetical protein
MKEIKEVEKAIREYAAVQARGIRIIKETRKVLSEAKTFLNAR